MSLTIAPAESEDSYEYTITNQKKHPLVKNFLEQMGLPTVCDRAKGIVAAIVKQLPNAIPRICNLHLLG